MELIPYSSNEFKTNGFTAEILQPHIERLLGVISSCKRDYVIFCGKVFEKLFKENIIGNHEFYLKKKNGEPTKNKTRFSNLIFKHNGKIIVAGLATSYPQQGIPMDEYGKKCKEHYFHE